MNREVYQLLISNTVQSSLNTLTEKAREYTHPDDMFHNFKVAATLQGRTKEQALTGMMAKHMVSIYDMVEGGKSYSKDVWQEKIGDGINYLLILSAMVKEYAE